MEWLATQQGVPSFKIFMFYGGHGLHGQADRAAQRRFLMVGEDESYDLAHFEFIMRAASRIRRAHPDLARHVSVSLHCEIADILDAYTRRVARDGALTGLRAYSAARPPHSEGLAVWIAGYLAHETDCPGINLLHLSSRKAVEAALALPRVFPHLDVRREVTVGHLLLDCDASPGVLAKVNPPIRPREDVEFLWRALLERRLDWVVSDHACCAREMKVAAERPDDIWLARSGYDADLALLDPARRFTVRAAESPSGQGYTPFEGLELTGRVTATFLRGALVYDGTRVLGPARGQYLKRPQ
jgi:allantoinase